MLERPAKVSEILEEAIDLADVSWDLRETSFELEAACRRLGVHVVHRWDADRGDDIPYEVLEQLRGAPALPLHLIEYQGEQWRVAAIDLPPEFDGMEVMSIPSEHTPRWLSLVRADEITDDL